MDASASNAAPGEPHTGVVLGFTSRTPGAAAVHVTGTGRHRLPCQSAAARSRLIRAVEDMNPGPEATLIVLGAQVGGLAAPARAALRRRIGFLPSGGGLLSNLNGWENITLPLEFHTRQRANGAAARLSTLAERLGAPPQRLFAALPEDMTLYERTLAGFLRMTLLAPELVLADGLASARGEEHERIAGLGAAYLEQCPGGTWIDLEST